MQENNTNKNKKGKPKMFLLFLLVASFIWFLTKFSREFTAILESEIEYVNVPHGLVITDDNYDFVSFDLTANGFDFLFYKINKPKISIDLSNYYDEGGTIITISNNELKRIITSQLKHDIIVNNVSIDIMQIQIDKLETKRVKVSLVESIQFVNGYKPIGEYRLVPDSINISGPAHHIDTINEVNTIVLKLTDVNENISKEIDLNISDDLSISYSQNTVNLDVIVKEFTQKSISVPITLINLPSDLNLNLIPSSVTVTFDISMEDFNKINANEFSVICDFYNKNDLENFMIPNLVKQPSEILNIEIKEDKIDYLILK